ncbi:MAG: ribonuclease PH [Planctomycetota bacterium]|nr:MAG: ribonuclease PH [Planctomycetota bacterium]
MTHIRRDGRKPSDLRPLSFTRRYTKQAPGSVLVSSGDTVVLCTCSVEQTVPEFLEGTGKGWLTAEYAMLPGSTNRRKPRERAGKPDGRGIEIQRLIGRALRTSIRLDKLGERTLHLDCDVLQADGGTRTASINGAYIALMDALNFIRSKDPALPLNSDLITGSVAAISIGLLEGRVLVDLDYPEDRDAEVDLNLVMTGAGQLIEIQAGGEESTFTRDQLDEMVKAGEVATRYITELQSRVLSQPLG